MFEGARSGTPEAGDRRRARAGRGGLRDARRRRGRGAQRAAGPGGGGGGAAGAGDRGACASATELPISADTFSAEVAARALEAGAVAINDISGAADPALFELAAETGCGLVLMHIEGPPREDREPPRYDDPVDHLKGWFAERIEAARRARGRPRSRSRSTPASTSTSASRDDLEILRRLGELRELGRPLYVSLSRKDFLGAVLAGSWEERLPGRAARVGDRGRDGARGRRGRRDPPAPRRERPAGDADRGARSGIRARAEVAGWLAAPPSPAAPGSPRSDPAARTAAWSARAPRRRRWRSSPTCRATSTPSWRRRWRAPGSSRSTRHQAEAFEIARARELILTSGTAVGQVALLQPAGARRDRARAEAPRVLPLPDQGARPGPGAQARRAAAARTCARRSTTATPRARSGPRSAAAPTSSSPTPTCSTSASSPTTSAGATSSPTSAGSSSTRRTPTAACSAPTSPTCCAGCGGWRALYGAEPRFLMASATIANPAELASRLTGLEFELLDDDGAPRAGREIAIWNPPVIEEATQTRRSPVSEVGRAALRAGPARRADDLLHEEPPRDRADQPLGVDEARPRTARATSPTASPPTAPATRRSSAARSRPTLASGRAARRGRHRRARARHRRRRARRGDLRQLPRHRRQPAPDVGARRAPAPRPRRLRRRPGRASTSSSAATPTSSSERPVESAILDHRSEQIRMQHLVAAAYEAPLGGADDDEVLGEGWREHAERLVDMGELRRASGERYMTRTGDFVAGRISLRSASADSLAVVDIELGRDDRPGRGRARLLHGPPRRGLPAPGPLLRGRRDGPRTRAARWSGPSTATTTRR